MPSRAALLATALLCWHAAPALAEPPATPLPSPLEELSGTVRAVDGQRHAVSVETAGGTVEVLLDRNTLVYQPGGATTVLGIVVGATVKVGVDGGRRAYWVQLRPAVAAKAP